MDKEPPRYLDDAKRLSTHDAWSTCHAITWTGAPANNPIETASVLKAMSSQRASGVRDGLLRRWYEISTLTATAHGKYKQSQSE